jgi:hypothetical protein
MEKFKRSEDRYRKFAKKDLLEDEDLNNLVKK